MKKLPSFTVRVASFVTSFDEAFTNTANEAIKPTTVGGRKAHLFSNRPLTVDESCTIVWGTSFGSIWVMATLTGQDPRPAPYRSAIARQRSSGSTHHVNRLFGPKSA